MVGACGLWLGMAILVGGIFPNVVQRFQVEPNEFTKEREYLVNNIQFTRKAFDIDKQTERAHLGLERITPEVVEANRGTIDNIRLWDERPLGEIYNQVEFVQFFYDFNSIGVDRYTINDEVQQVMLFHPGSLGGEAAGRGTELGKPTPGLYSRSRRSHERR